MKLDLVVTHWKEPWDDFRTFLIMLNMQRGIRDGECRLIFVQDGDDTGGFDPEQVLTDCIIPSVVHRIPHGGVSKARNTGLDMAEADWVMFCDCDDCLYSVDSLRTILDSIDEAGDRADLLWAPFWMEMENKDGQWRRQIQNRNWIFIHGKVWRREWLNEHRIRFNEEIAYSEDALFNTEAGLEIEPSRIAHMKEPVYMWCKRKGSCTENPENAIRNRRHMFHSRILKPDICIRRGLPYDAMTHAMRGILDSYYELVGGTIPEAEQEVLERMVTDELIRPWYKRIRITSEDMNELGIVSRNSAIRKRAYPGEEKDGTWEDYEPFTRWVAAMLEKYQEGG